MKSKRVHTPLGKVGALLAPEREIVAPLATAGAVVPLGCPGFPPVTEEQALLVARQGYCPMNPVLKPGCDDALMDEIDRLIADGRIGPARDRVVDDVTTEHIVNLGEVWGQGPNGTLLQQAPMLRSLYSALQRWARGYNDHRTTMVASGWVRAEEVPEVAPEGIEMNVNRVVGTSRTRWSGLHLHRDYNRFTDGLKALDEGSVRHAAIRVRALTTSFYLRPRGEDGSRLNDTGGALVFMLREPVLGPGDRSVFDVVMAHHNAGAWFLPSTVHGVARMTPGGVRYSVQAFFPRRDVWEAAIRPRIVSGELAEELALAARQGRVGWR